MNLLNFTHPLSPAHLQAIGLLASREVERVIDRSAHFDHGVPFAGQVRELLDGVGLTPAEWQGTPLVVNLPSLSAIAGPLLAELHGRMGYFPSILRMRPIRDALPPAFEVAEILNLQCLRDQARQLR